MPETFRFRAFKGNNIRLQRFQIRRHILLNPASHIRDVSLFKFFARNVLVELDVAFRNT